MAKIGKVQEVAIAELKPYANNAKIHGEDQLEKLRASIREFGFISPCLIDSEKNIIAGHGRVMAAEQLGMKKVPCVYVEGLTEEQRRAYILADNRLGELGDWNVDIIFEELADLDASDFDVELTGFALPDQGTDWFEARERFDMSREEGNDEYNAFLDKFEQPKTTDDCYTPDNIYDAVAEYVANKYGADRSDFVRPFYPGGDYQKEHYKAGAVVVDNPPFSILSEIVDWYTENGIRFFLFAPGLAVIGYTSRPGVCALCMYSKITYENGANVQTSFVTNMEDPGLVAVTDPDFWKTLDEINTENEKRMKTSFPKYVYPVHVATSARLGYLSEHGQELKIYRKDTELIRALDAQKEFGKGLYGAGLLLSEKAAAEKAAAEKAAAEKAAAEKGTAENPYVWELSEREWEIVRNLGGGSVDG